MKLKRLSILGMALALVLPALTLFAQPATAATPECYGVTFSTVLYPVDATNNNPDQGHFQQCFEVHPTAAQNQTIGMVGGFLQGNVNPIAGHGAGGDIEDVGAHFYIFATRDTYNAFVTARWPNPNGGNSKYLATTDRCGKTVFNPGYVDSRTHQSVGLISAIFYFCTYNGTGQTTLDPNPVEAMQHETGHSFTSAVGGQFKDSGPGRTAAWQSIVQDDLNHLDAVWTARPVNQRDTYVCDIFGSGKVLSDLEKDLKTTLVCPAGVNKFPGQKPSAVLGAALPYFFTAAPGRYLYEEIWAQLMIPNTGGPGSPDILIATNTALASMSCAKSIYTGYYLTGVAPQTNDPRYNACTRALVHPNPKSFR